MSEETTPDEVLKLVEKAQSKGVFDIAAFAKGRALPQDTVTAYLNVDAAYRLDKINKEIASELDSTVIESLEAKAKKIADEVIASKVIFHMRGVTQAEVEAVS
jgi:hypothetical protein